MTLPPSFDVIPPDREDGQSSWVHRALILSGRLGAISPHYLLPLWLLSVVLVGWPWGPLRWVLTGIASIYLIGDWVMLAALHLKHRSWGPVTPPLLGLLALRWIVFLGGYLVVGPDVPAALATGLVNLGITGAAVYATWIEPFRVTVTPQSYSCAHGRDRSPIRIAHVSDIHFEGFSPREERLLALLQSLQPDVILLTGDYLNLSSVYDPEAQAGVRSLLQRIAINAPRVYAVTGSPVVDRPSIVPEIFQGLPIRWLDDEMERLEIDGAVVWLLGVRNTYNFERDAEALRSLTEATPAGACRILLYHTPDLMPVAAQLDIDLYLCGHTHGGQICLPFYGAVATSSRWGKRYEQGRYIEGRTTLYVSRGLGMEGLGAPRARFLAPPEIVMWKLELPIASSEDGA